MRRLVERILSVLFPPYLDGRLTDEELRESLHFRHRDSRHRKGFIWSSAGNVKQLPAKPTPTTQERRNRDLQDYVGMSVSEHCMYICKRSKWTNDA